MRGSGSIELGGEDPGVVGGRLKGSGQGCVVRAFSVVSKRLSSRRGHCSLRSDREGRFGGVATANNCVADGEPERTEIWDRWTESGDVGDGGIEGSRRCDGGPASIDLGDGGSGNSGDAGLGDSSLGGVGGGGPVKPGWSSPKF